MFFPPIPLIRKRRIIQKLTEHKAFSAETAVSFKEAGIINPNAFGKITQKLVNDNVIKKAENNKYYLA